MKIPLSPAQKHGLIEIAMIIGVFMIFSLSCNKGETSQPSWETPFQQWQALNPHNYTIDQRRTCFCPYGGELVRITVRSDTIAKLVRISDSSVVTYPFYLTVDALFGMIHNSNADSMVIRYNTQYGYPEFLDVQPQLHPVDGGFLYETSNLQIR